jgi:hypothetical protein
MSLFVWAILFEIALSFLYIIIESTCYLHSSSKADQLPLVCDCSTLEKTIVLWQQHCSTVG